jgi:hypothetical protein
MMMTWTTTSWIELKQSIAQSRIDVSTSASNGAWAILRLVIRALNNCICSIRKRTFDILRFYAFCMAFGRLYCILDWIKLAFRLCAKQVQ